MKKFLSIAAAVCLCASVLCACSNTDSYHTPYSTQADTTASTSAIVESTALTEAPAPKISDGSYDMHCGFEQSAVYTYEGNTYMTTEWDVGSWYALDVKNKDGAPEIKFTITRKNYLSNYNGTPSVLFDTDDASTLDADTKVYFDMVGLSFTAVYDKNNDVVSLKGVDALHKKCPAAKDILSEDTLMAVAQELVLNLPDVVKKDEGIEHRQLSDGTGTLDMTYTATDLTDTMLKFSMKLNTLSGLPESEYGDGYSVEFTDSSNYSGTLVISTADRMKQSSSNSITYKSTMTLGEGGDAYILDGTTTVTDTCEVTKSASSK